MEGLKSLLVLSALVAVSVADCSVDGLHCCLTEFLSLVSPAGIRLTEKNLAEACKIGWDSFECIEDFTDQCVAQGNDELEGSINKTKAFISTTCNQTSDFKKSVKEYENCFLNASQNFQTCYNKTLLPESSTDDKSKWTAECREYRDLRNCAVQSVENVCGATASQVLQDEVVNLNGAGLEVACQEIFKELSAAGVALASSLLPILLLATHYTTLKLL